MIKCNYCLKERESNIDNSITNKNYQNQICNIWFNYDLNDCIDGIINNIQNKGKDKEKYYHNEAENKHSLSYRIRDNILFNIQENKENVCIYCAARLRKIISDILYKFYITNNTWNRKKCYEDNIKLNNSVQYYLDIKYLKDIKENLTTIIVMANAIFIENRVKKLKINNKIKATS